MAVLDEITDRLEDFKTSGLIVAYEVMVADDSFRIRIVTPARAEPEEVKGFIVETLAGLLSASQISAERAPA